MPTNILLFFIFGVIALLILRNTSHNFNDHKKYRSYKKLVFHLKLELEKEDWKIKTYEPAFNMKALPFNRNEGGLLLVILNRDIFI